jgi:hypothetical protein
MSVVMNLYVAAVVSRGARSCKFRAPLVQLQVNANVERELPSAWLNGVRLSLVSSFLFARKPGNAWCGLLKAESQHRHELIVYVKDEKR